jgi:hypothetical protein
MCHPVRDCLENLWNIGQQIILADWRNRFLFYRNSNRGLFLVVHDWFCRDKMPVAHFIQACFKALSLNAK